VFNNEELGKAIGAALNQPDIIPQGKKMALVAVAQADGSVKAAIAYRVGGHWQAGGEVDWHGGAIEGGVKVQASW
jgi:hypothetical protein